MTDLRRLRVPSILLLIALTATLVFAAGAAAETKIGEGTSPADPSLPGEADLLRGTATYEPGTGSATFTVVTREAEQTTPEEKRSLVQYVGGLVTAANGSCTEANLEAEAEAGNGYPIFGIIGSNNTPGAGEPSAEWVFEAHKETQHEAEEEAKNGPNPEDFGPATKTFSGATTTLTATVGKAVNGPFNCVELGAEWNDEETHETKDDFAFFPLTVKPTPAPPIPTPAPTPTAAFSLTKIKPLKAKVGKWTKVKVDFTNTGTAAAGPVTVKLKRPKGVLLKPASGKLSVPSLAAGQTWTLTFRAKLTTKAKKKSTVEVTTSSGAVSASSSFVITRLG